MIENILFDLDGTLLPMDQEVFTQAYFRRLAAKLQPLGYDPKQLIDGIWAGTAAMVRNDGSRTNEEAFWAKFEEIFGKKVLADRPVFEEYYRVEFQQAAAVCGCNPAAKAVVETLRQQGRTLVLATNPIFPAVATESRVRWAGLALEDFAFYTCYENSRHCKPNPAYYRDVLDRLGASPDRCLMVGNDVEEDMVARELGIDVFLLTDCLINKKQRDIAVYPHGGFPDLLDYLAER